MGAGLTLLGLGWSASVIAGSTLLAESVPESGRVPAQGLSDTLMGAAGAMGACTLRTGAGRSGIRRPERGRGGRRRGPAGCRRHCPAAGLPCGSCRQRAMPSRRAKIASPSSAMPSWWNSPVSQTCSPADGGRPSPARARGPRRCRRGTRPPPAPGRCSRPAAAVVEAAQSDFAASRLGDLPQRAQCRVLLEVPGVDHFAGQQRLRRPSGRNSRELLRTRQAAQSVASPWP